MPTAWISGILVGAFLAVTAAFGGLATAQTPEPPRIEAGDAHIDAQLSLTVSRAVLLDDFPEAGAFAGEGEQVLALQVTAENRWSEALPTSGAFTVSQILRIPRLGDAPPGSVARYDDATLGPWLQPGVPAELVVTWVVPDSTFTREAELEVEILGSKLVTGSSLTSGQNWVPTEPAAMLVLPIEHVGTTGDAQSRAEDGS